MRLDPIPPERLVEYWPLLEPYLSRREAEFPDDWPVSETLEQAQGGRLLLWLVWDRESNDHYAILGTEVSRKPSGKRVLLVRWLVGRDLRRWLPMARTALADHARENGCERVELMGRAGLEKLLPDLAMERWVTVTMDASDGDRPKRQ